MDSLKSKENKRHCRHSHGKRTSVEEPTLPPSPINEDDEEEDNVNILKIEDRPTTSSSDLKSVGVTPSPTPQPRRLDRPSSTRSVFEHIAGTRPASRRVSGSLLLLQVSLLFIQF